MPLPEADSSEDTGEFSLHSGIPQSSPLIAHFGAASHVGLRRPNNEDHYAVVQRSRTRKILLTNVDTVGLRLPDDEAYAMIVADGMGGCGFGELASELVLRIGWELAGAAPCWVMKFRAGVIDKIREKIAAYGRQIQEELREYAANDPALADMGTTWTCGYLMGRDAIVAHVGDSRAYLFHDQSVRQLTRDHTFAQTLRDVGVPAEETAQYKHLLVNSFGPRSENVKIDVDHVPLEDGDRMLLCSDGLTDMVSDEEITSTLVEVPGAQAACDALIERALHNGGKDNVTVIVADLGDQPG
jgi:PPM family protein phosphatase